MIRVAWGSTTSPISRRPRARPDDAVSAPHAAPTIAPGQRVRDAQSPRRRPAFSTSAPRAPRSSVGVRAPPRRRLHLRIEDHRRRALERMNRPSRSWRRCAGSASTTRKRPVYQLQRLDRYREVASG
jgi:hypothetical protein